MTHHHPPSISPAATASATLTLPPPPPSKLPIDFSPPLIAMVVIAAAAFLLITYSRHVSRFLSRPLLTFLRRRRRHHPSDIESPPPPFFESSDGNLFFYSPYGLDEAVISRIPLSLFTQTQKPIPDCAVCLLEFEDGDYFRTLPVCSHAFHVDCIDEWLRSHATCPICRGGVNVLALHSPLSPIMSPRMSSALDFEFETLLLHPLIETDTSSSSGEIQELGEDCNEVENVNNNDDDDDRFLLKRSYSFGFERSFTSERMMVLEALTTPYHHHRHWRRTRGGGGNGSGGMFFKRPASTTPFGSVVKSRVFSFRSGGDRKFYSPGFFRFSKKLSPVVMSMSRMRSGDPEALISPERFGGR